MDLVVRHPGLLRPLVSHEAFLVEVFRDSAKCRSRLNDLSETYRTEGVFAGGPVHLPHEGHSLTRLRAES